MILLFYLIIQNIKAFRTQYIIHYKGKQLFNTPYTGGLGLGLGLGFGLR